MSKMNNSCSALAIVVSLLLASCSSKQQSSPDTAVALASAQSSAPAARGPAQAEGEYKGITAAVQELKRGPDTLRLKVEMSNRSDRYFVLSNDFSSSRSYEISAVYLLDAANKKEYPVARDKDGECVCDHDPKAEVIQTDSSIVKWAEFPLPPEDVQKITVVFPHFPPFVDVPITRASEAQPPSAMAMGVGLDLVFRVEDLGGKVESLKVKETDMEVQIEMPADVLFDFNKADILPKAQAALKHAADIIRQKAKGTVRIEGHTDSIGSDARNQRLSEQRAESVKSWFIREEGLSNVSFTTQGFGATKPVAPNRKPDGSDDPEGRQKNRRVEIVIAK
jgi:outer membrane protein OmpA-like peptidoglycan-associated protein